jgi:6-phosphogluconate dehydrogenase
LHQAEHIFENTAIITNHQERKRVMQIGMIGLGRMGMNMVRRLIQGGHQVVAYNRSADKIEAIVKEGAQGATSLNELVDRLPSPRIVWLMLPAGDVVEEHIEQLCGLLSAGDIIVEGGNSFYKDDIRRAKRLATDQIHYVDAGVSGGIWGLTIGYCTMVGGEKETFDYLEPLFKTLAPENGYLYCGKTGAGHFVKMIHNGIEYAMMQAYGEGFELLEASPYADGFDYAKIAALWNQGSVIRSWLLELLQSAFSHDAKLTDIRGHVDDSGEGRWTVQQAIESDVPAEVIALSLFRRFRSRQSDTFTDRVLAALRKEFGGHATVASAPQHES